MTKPQIEALRLLSVRRCYTAVQTYGDMCIAGAVAKVLVAKHYARYVRGWQVGIAGSTVVEITELGRDAVAEALLAEADRP